MKPEAEMLWRLFDEHRASARHHDQQREKVTHCVLLLAAAALGLAQFGPLSDPRNYLLAGFIIVAGGAGLALTASHSDDCKGQITCATEYRTKIERLYPEVELDTPAPEPRQATGKPWAMIHLLVIFLGIVLLGCALLSGAAKARAEHPRSKTPSVATTPTGS